MVADDISAVSDIANETFGALIEHLMGQVVPQPFLLPLMLCR